MSILVRELRDKTGLTQKEFAGKYGIPLSTLRKWEQRESTPPEYVLNMLEKSLTVYNHDTKESIKGADGKMYYYDDNNMIVSDQNGNSIHISESLKGVKRENLALYITDLFEGFYELQEKFNFDCRMDKTETVIWR